MPSPKLQLVIGSKRFSSWSLRAWLALEHVGAPYEEILIPFTTPDWREQVRRHSRERRGAASGPHLFGAFSAADCFYAPVVFRFLSYGVPLAATARAYCDAITAHPSVAKWRAAALREPSGAH